MSGVVPDVALNDGVEMPMLGFGVFQTPPRRRAPQWRPP